MSDVKIRIRVEEMADLEAAHGCAKAQEDIRMEAIVGTPSGEVEVQMAPITAVLIAAGVAVVAKFVADWWERLRGGLVIDMRPNAEDQIRRDRNVPYGIIVIFPTDGGQVKIESHDMPKDGIQQLLEFVISGAYKTVLDIAKIAKKALPDASVEETPAASTA